MAKPPHAIEDIYPLSPMQEGMLFHSLYGEEEGAPLLQWSCRFESGIDAAAFRSAWERVMERHAILRTAVVLEEAEDPVQVVFGSVPLPWREQDLSGLSAPDRAHAIEDYLERDRQVRFELTEQTRKAIDEHLRIAGRRPGQFLFAGRRGVDSGLTTRQYARLVGEWIASIGLDPLKFGTHSLRRTKATLIYCRTGNLRAVQLLLGHTKIESTVRYLGVEIDDAIEIAEKIDV